MSNTLKCTLIAMTLVIGTVVTLHTRQAMASNASDVAAPSSDESDGFDNNQTAGGGNLEASFPIDNVPGARITF